MKSKCLLTALLILLGATTVAQPVTITPSSANIDPGASVTLTASGALYYVWSPATGLSTTEGPETVASPMVTTTYTCEGYAPGDESVVNGDFSLGATGFTSAYQYNSNLWGEGTYFVDNDASLHHESFAGHGHNGGNFMIVNGATSPGTNVWTEQISVNPNTYYAFSTWACNVSVGDPDQVALLQFSINGTQIGDIFHAPNQLNTWMQFYELWYSGSSTSATITILNQNTVAGGNDFGLDDISFRELVLVGAPQCTIIVGSMSASASADDTEICEGQSTTLHALPTGGSGNYSYSWTPTNTLNNPTAQHPIATPGVTTTYTCTITDNGWGGEQTPSVTIQVRDNIVIHRDTTICSNETCLFYDTIVSRPGTYQHHETTQYGCDKTIYLHLDNWPTYDTIITKYICHGESYEFYGIPYTQSTQPSEIYHTDHTLHGCDSIVRLNLTVYPPNDTTFVVPPSICEGDSYLFHGIEYSQDTVVYYYDTDNHGCLKVEKLVLSVAPYQQQYVPHFECYEHGSSPSWTWDKNGFTYRNDTIDRVLLDDPNGGCDILYTLDLKFHEEFYNEEWQEACDTYTWPINEETYTVSKPQVVETFQHDFGTTQCDSTYILHLEIINYTPQPTPIFPVYTNNIAPHWVVTATEFQINTYDFHLYDSIHPAENHWDEVRWSFVKKTNGVWQEDPSVQWILEPDTTLTPPGRQCKLYVLNHIADTVWLEAKVYNDCKTEGVPRHYWLVSSFYGINEQPPIDAKVYPNPTQGLLTVEAEKMERIRVIDMLGQVVSDIECNHDNLITLNLDALSASVYLVEIKTADGTCKQRIVINR